MKVLFLAQPFPYPPDTGSRNLIFHWLDAVSRVHEVHLFWLGDRAQGMGTIPGLTNVNVRAIDARPAMDFGNRLRRFWRAVSSLTPATSIVGMEPGIQDAIVQAVREGDFDLVVLTENIVAGYASLLSPYVPVMLFKHSVQAVDARDMRRRLGMWHPRWVLEEWIVKAFERRTCRSATTVCTVNVEDSADLQKRYGLARAPEVVPIGVDCSDFPRREYDPGGATIAFFGNIVWGANLDAANWFVEFVLPRIWERVPAAQFRIIGPGSDRIVPQNRDPRLLRVGPSHIPSLTRDAVIGVVPVISGTGVRLKLLEMLSMGVPVVTTTLGALGTNCVNGQHALIADDPDAFAKAVVCLLEDSDLRTKLTRAGSELAKGLSWQSVYPRILHILELTAHQHTKTNLNSGVPLEVS